MYTTAYKNLPKPLEESELIKSFELFKNGNEEERNKIVIHNMRLVLSVISKNFLHSGYELEDLISIGMLGLIQSVEGFDKAKKINFSTYATKCVYFSIINYINRNKRHKKNLSIEESINTEETAEPIFFKSVLVDKDINIEEDYEEKELINETMNSVSVLKEREQEILKLYYGFYNDRCYTQKEIAQIYGVTPVRIGKIIKISLDKLRKNENLKIKSFQMSKNY